LSVAANRVNWVLHF